MTMKKKFELPFDAHADYWSGRREECLHFYVGSYFVESTGEIFGKKQDTVTEEDVIKLLLKESIEYLNDLDDFYDGGGFEEEESLRDLRAWVARMTG